MIHAAFFIDVFPLMLRTVIKIKKHPDKISECFLLLCLSQFVEIQLN